MALRPAALHAAVARLELDLRGRTVLTEAATGPYVVTAILAALAGARVLAHARSTAHGTQEEVFALVAEVATWFGPLDITPLSVLTPAALAEADVVTNSGHLRPLDAHRLRHLKAGAVISLMYEAWEYRPADIDLEYCRSRGIPVAGVDERHPDVDVFGYLGDMALKLLFDAGTCPYGNTLVLMCNNAFGPAIARTLAGLCRRLGVIDLARNRPCYEALLELGRVEWLAEFPRARAPVGYRDASAVVFTAAPFHQAWLAPAGPVDAAELREAFPEAVLLRFAGDLSTEILAAHGIGYAPATVRPGHMGVLPSEIGFDPVIRLQAGGLKVGELLLSGERCYRGHPLVQPVCDGRVAPLAGSPTCHD